MNRAVVGPISYSFGRESFQKPSKDVGDFEKLLPEGADVLDVGANKGANSIFLASLGHNAIALERNFAAASEGSEIAKALGEKAASHSFVVGDILSPPFSRQFDAVLCMIVLQEIAKPDWPTAINNIMRLTKSGGLNLVRVYTGTPQQQRMLSGLNLFGQDEIVEIYRDKGWEMVTEPLGALKPLDEHDGRVKVDSFNLITARKPEVTPAKSSEPTYLGRPYSYWQKASPATAALMREGNID